MNARFAFPALFVLLTGCNGAPSVPFVGIGKIPLNVMSVTTVNPDTQKVSSKTYLRWQGQPGAKIYNVIATYPNQPGKVIASQDSVNYTDENLDIGQTATYKIQAMSGEGKELNASDDKTASVLPQQVGKPTLSEPADNASLSVGQMPTLKWGAVDGASWYYVKVINGTNNAAVYTALTKDTSAKFGDASPLKFDNFGDLFPTGAKADISQGIIYRWTVQAIRGDSAADPNAVKGIDVNTSPSFKFSQG
jgi:hypothetical protein